MYATKSTFMREKSKTDHLVLKFSLMLFFSAILLMAALITLKSCSKEYTEPVMAAEVSLPTVTRSDEVLELTQEEKCAYLGEGCTSEQIAEREKDMRIYRVQEEIKKQADEYGVDYDMAMAIAECESQFDTYAANPNSTAKGVYQFLDGTWEWIKASGHQYDYKENIKQFMIWYPIHPEYWSECLEKLSTIKH